jgi:hypothetical protein
VELQVRVDPRNAGVRVTLRTPLNASSQRAEVLLDGQPVGTFAPPVEHAGDVVDRDGAPVNEQILNLPEDLTAGKERVSLANVLLVPDSLIVVESIIDGVPVRTDQVLANELRRSASAPANEPFPEMSAPAATIPSGASGTPVGAPPQEGRLRIAFDGRWTVDSPLGEFFGTGLGHDAGPVAALLFAVDANGWHSAWWPMPYGASATVELLNDSGEALMSGVAEITTAPLATSTAAVAADGVTGYFSATAAQGPTAPGRDWLFLDARGMGKVVGVSSVMAGAGPGRAYLEGDERVLVDGARSPAMHGTGTEDFYGGGWYFNRGPFSAPLNGATAHHMGAPDCPFECDAAYRLLLADAIPFEAAVRFSIEHGPRNQEAGTYASTTFWYGRPEFGLWRDDIRDIGDGDADAESAAMPTSTARSGVEALTATFEGEDDTVPVIDDGRGTSDEASFKLSIHRDNRGVKLRRLTDQAIGGQAVQVYVDDVDVGVWSQPLQNTHHRWLEDEFPLPAAITRGRSRMAVRLRPLPGAPDWHAARYEALSLVSAFREAAAPGVVQGLQAQGDGSNAVTLSWKPAVGKLPTVRYQVFAAGAPGVEPRAENLVGETRVSGFVHTGLGLDQIVFYRVLAVDVAGSLGRTSDEVNATTGRTLQLEAEALLPPESASAPVIAQDMRRFGAGWSDGQLLFQAVQPGDQVTVGFHVPTAGRYELVVAPTRARDYGIFLLSVDGVPVGVSFDGYGPGVAPAGLVGFGELGLAMGHHVLTLTITAKTAASLGYNAGLDHVRLNLLRPENV